MFPARRAFCFYGGNSSGLLKSLEWLDLGGGQAWVESALFFRMTGYFNLVGVPFRGKVLLMGGDSTLVLREDGLHVSFSNVESGLQCMEWVSGVQIKGTVYAMGKHDEEGKNEECGVFDGKLRSTSRAKGSWDEFDLRS